jgi:hypothetical protein
VSIQWLALLGAHTDEPGPQPEDSIEQGFRGPEAVADEPSCRRAPRVLQLGCSESIDPNNVGDIADEGAGHRG